LLKDNLDKDVDFKPNFLIYYIGGVSNQLAIIDKLRMSLSNSNFIKSNAKFWEVQLIIAE